MRSAIAGIGLLAAGCGGLARAYQQETVLYDGAARRQAAAAAAGGFGRILELEHVHGELTRAIAAGLDADGELAAKRQAVAAELEVRIADAGDALGTWRQARLAELRAFAIEPPPPAAVSPPAPDGASHPR